MSFQTTITYDNPANFAFDNSKIDVTDAARLKLQETFTTCVEDFADDTDFVYDNDDAEFVGGQVQQKAQLQSGETFRALYGSSIDANYAAGSPTGTAVGGASVSSGKLDLKGGTTKYVDYDGEDNAPQGNTGALRFKLTPNYSGAPATDTQFFVGMSQGPSNNNNFVAVQHDAVSGNIRINFVDNGGVSRSVILPAWSPTSGVEYEFELNWDTNVGVAARRLFINGVQHGTTDTTAFTRGSTSHIRVGTNPTNPSTSFQPNFEIDDVQIFDTVQHTANYTPSALGALYPTTNVTVAPFVHMMVGWFLEHQEFATTEVGTPRYTGKSADGTFKYWNGAAWVDSDGTYAQANTKADFNANIGTFPLETMEIVFTVKIHFTASPTQSSVDHMTIEHLAFTEYPDSDPTIVPNVGQLMDGLDGFEEDVELSTSGDEDIRYTLVVGSQDKYWNGTAWVNSNGTYAQSNTATEIQAVASSLNLMDGAIVKVKAFLHTDDGQGTPVLTSVTLTYNFYAGSPTPAGDCLIYGWLYGPGNTPREGVAVEARPRAEIQDGSILVVEQPGFATETDEDGYWELNLIAGEYDFIFGNVPRQQRLKRVVPDAETCQFNSLQESVSDW